MMAPERTPVSFGTLVAHAMLLPLYAATCVLAFVLVPHRVGKLLSSALELAGHPRDAHHAPFAAGATACTFALAIVGACGVGRAAAPALAHGGESATAAVTMLVALAAPAIVGAVLAPFLLAPFALLDGEAGIVESVVRSFELAARRGAALTMRDGGLLGASVGVVSIFVAGVSSPHSMTSMVVVLALAIVLLTPLAAWLLARAYVDARSRPAFAGVTDARVSRSLRTVALLVVPAALAVALALLAALLTPAPMARLDRTPESWGSPLPSSTRGIALPGAHGLSVRYVGRGVSVDAADGGGAGEIALPRSASDDYGIDLLAYRVPEGGWAIVLFGHVTYVDDEGVRLDDSLADRLSPRVSRQTLALLLLALALGAWWQRRMRRTLVDAAALDAPALRRDAAPDAVRLARVSGRLRLEEGSVVVTHGTTAQVEGAGRFVSSDGEIVIALPSELPLLVPHEAGGIADGREVSLLVRSDALARVGLREGATPWPEGARLLATDRDDAAEALLTRAARATSLIALGIASSLAWAAFSIVTSL